MASILPAVIHLLTSIRRILPGTKGIARRSPYGVLLPRVSHMLMSEEDIAGRNLLVIGDVHGCYDELRELLEEQNVTEESNNTCIIFVGDLINKGPKNAQVVKLARKLRAYSVRGNHDEVCLLEWEKAQQRNGQLSDKFRWMSQLTPQDIQWLYDMPYTISVPSRNFIIVHAGLLPGCSLKEQSPEDMITMRNIIEDESDQGYKSIKGDGGVCWASKWEGPSHIYFGHDARRLLQQHPYATGLDTGCVYGGHLTAVYPVSGKLVSVKAHSIHKPTSNS